jgi:hypothetical protein
MTNNYIDTGKINFNYIENPIIKTQRVKMFVKTLMNKGDFDKWAILFTSSKKSDKELRQLRQKVYSYRQQYPYVDWEIHYGDDSYSIICRKTNHE